MQQSIGDLARHVTGPTFRDVERDHRTGLLMQVPSRFFGTQSNEKQRAGAC
jgi:hypothetical protein